MLRKLFLSIALIFTSGVSLANHTGLHYNGNWQPEVFPYPEDGEDFSTCRYLPTSHHNKTVSMVRITKPANEDRFYIKRDTLSGTGCTTGAQFYIFVKATARFDLEGGDTLENLSQNNTRGDINIAYEITYTDNMKETIDAGQWMWLGEIDEPATRKGTFPLSTINLLQGQKFDTTIVNLGTTYFQDPENDGMTVSVTLHSAVTNWVEANNSLAPNHPLTISVDASTVNVGRYVFTIYAHTDHDVSLNANSYLDSTIRLWDNPNDPREHYKYQNFYQITINVAQNNAPIISLNTSSPVVFEGVTNGTTSLVFTIIDPNHNRETVDIDFTHDIFELVSLAVPSAHTSTVAYIATLQVKNNKTISNDQFIPITITASDANHTIINTFRLSVNRKVVVNPVSEGGVRLDANNAWSFTLANNTFSDPDGEDIVYVTQSQDITPTGHNININNLVFSKTGGTVGNKFTIHAKAHDGNTRSLSTASFTLTIFRYNIPALTRSGSQVVINENTNAGSRINLGYRYSIEFDGPESLLSYELEGADASHFTLSDDNRQIIMTSTVNFDYDTKSNYIVTYKVTYAEGVLSASSRDHVTVAITDINEAITMSILGTYSTISEGTISGGNRNTGLRVSIFDPEASYEVYLSDNRFRLAGGNANGQRALQALNNAVFNYENEADRAITLVVSANDGGNFAAVTTTLEIGNLIEPVGFAATLPTQTVYINSEYRFTITEELLTLDYATPLTSFDANIRNFPAIAFTLSNFILAGKLTTEGPQPIEIRLSNPTTATIRIDFTLNLLITNRIDELEAQVVHDHSIKEVIAALGNTNVNSISKRVGGLTNPAGPVFGFSDEVLNLINEKRDLINRGEVSLEELLAGESFVFGSHQSSGSGESLGFWADFDYSKVQTYSAADYVDLEGSVFSANAGVDQKVGSNIFGVAFGMHTGQFDYEIYNRTTEVTDYGTYEMDLSMFQPYLGRNFTNTNFWTTFGFGTGEIELKARDKEEVVNNNVTVTTVLNSSKFVSKLDAKLMAAGLGFETEVMNIQRSNNNHDKINVFGDYYGTRVEADPTTPIGEYLKTTNHNYRVGASYILDRALDHGDLESSLGFGFRNWGYEVFGGTNLEYTDYPVYIGLELRYIDLEKSDTEFREVGGNAYFRIANTDSNLGLSVLVNPTYGNYNQDLMGVDTTQALNELVNQAIDLELNTEFAYGVGIPNGILTPYGNYKLVDKDANYGMGLRYSRNEKVTWDLGYTQDRDPSKYSYLLKYRYSH